MNTVTMNETEHQSETVSAASEAPRLAAALRALLEVTQPYWVLPQVKMQYDEGRAALRAWDGYAWREAADNNKEVA